jgi:metallophosphoesterase (TIGR00282 family)
MVVRTQGGARVAVACALGQLFMKPVDSPFRAIDRILEEIPAEVRVRLVDFHAEATSEKQQLARHLDGRVSAVLGTHTHVPTADSEILPHGTAFQCDVGMTGPYDSIIGRRTDRVLETTLTAYPTKFDVATGDARLCGAIVQVDGETGRATSIERVCVRAETA